MQLNQSQVTYIPDPIHEYWLGDLQLHGTSHLYGNHINPLKYEGISPEVLQKAAERGTLIHEQCEMADRFGLAESTEAKNWVAIKEKEHITVLENEYLISDLVYYATKIDKVLIVGEQEEGLIDLGDVKTTSELDMESLSWQLSISANLFELQNPHLKCRKLYGIWLRGNKKRFVEVERKPTEQVKSLMDAEQYGLPFVLQTEQPAILTEQMNKQLQRVADLESLIQTTKKELETRQSNLDNLKAFLLQQMSEYGVKKMEGERVIITYVDPYEKELFDSKRFKEDNPTEAEKYIKKSQVKESIKIKLK